MTVRQPWGRAIACLELPQVDGGQIPPKRILCREDMPPAEMIGAYFAIHVGSTVSTAELRRLGAVGVMIQGPLATNAVVAVAKLAWATLTPPDGTQAFWWAGAKVEPPLPVGWVLRDVTPLPRSVPGRAGRGGKFWTLPDAVEADVEAQWRAEVERCTG